MPHLQGYPPEKHLASLVGYLECPLGEQLGFLQESLVGWWDLLQLGDSLHRQDCSELGHSPEYVRPALAYQEQALREPAGLLPKCLPESDNISVSSEEDSELGDLPGLEVEDCTDLGNSPGLWVGGCSALGDLLRQENCSELEGWPGLEVGDCSDLGDSPGLRGVVLRLGIRCAGRIVLSLGDRRA